MSVDLPRKGRYRHFKGGEYEVIGVARHSETDEPLVIYRALYPCPDTPNGEGIWARPLSSWNAPAAVEGKSVPRFAPVADEVPLPEPPPEEAVFAAPLPEMPAAAPAPISAEPCEAPEAVLKRVFGYETFREGQKETIDAILAGRDVLAVMPTGSGKSICYQVPALSLPGCALVISPLISLMKDQVAALKQSGVAAAFLNSSLTERQMDIALGNLAGGQYKLVYVAPERLLTPRFLSLCRALPISMVAVDEAHCISQWGQDFRPSYLDIPKFIAALPARPRLCAFTATATKRVRGDIQRLLGLREPFALVTGFDRPNLRFFVERPRDRMAALFRVLGEHEGESGIVYCATRKAVEQVCDKLRAQGVSATRYHAGLVRRRAAQEPGGLFLRPRAGDGGHERLWHGHRQIRRALRRALQHAQGSGKLLSGSGPRRARRRSGRLRAALWQERCGHAALSHRENGGGGRPGRRRARPQPERAAWQRLEQMTAYCQTDQCLRAHILRYFGEEAADRCGACGNCLRPAELGGRHAAGAAGACAACRTSTAASARGSSARRFWAARSSACRRRGLDRSPHYGSAQGRAQAASAATSSTR